VAELDELGAREIDTSGLRVSTAAHLVMPYHQSLDRAEDAAREERRLGTTGRGIGPTYVDKARRIGLRVGDLLNPSSFRGKLRFVLDRKYHELAAVGVAKPDPEAMADEYLTFAERLRPFITETQPLVDEAVARGRQVVLEGAHATLLDLDHGTYPYVTSSHCTVAGLLQGSGIGPRRLTRASSSTTPPTAFARSGMSTAPPLAGRAAVAGSTLWPGATHRVSMRSMASPSRVWTC